MHVCTYGDTDMGMSVDIWARTNINNKQTHMAAQIWDTWACIWHMPPIVCVCRHYQYPQLMCMSSCVSLLICMCTCLFVPRQVSCSWFVWACSYVYTCTLLCMGTYVHACTYTIERDIQQYYRARPHAHKVGTERQYTPVGTYMFMQTHMSVHSCMHTQVRDTWEYTQVGKHSSMTGSTWAYTKVWIHWCPHMYIWAGTHWFTCTHNIWKIW